MLIKFVMALVTTGRVIPARAQSLGRVRAVAVVLGRKSTDVEGQGQLQAFREALSQAGWTRDRVRIDPRWAGEAADDTGPFAREIVSTSPEVIVVQTTALVSALLRETRDIPVVFVAVTDPVTSGFVASLSRPGGNATGLIDLEPSLGAKWVGLLKQITPRLQRVGAVYNPDTSSAASSYLASIKKAASDLNLESVEIAVRKSSDFEAELATFARTPGGGLIAIPDIFNGLHQSLLISLAAQHQLPAVYAFPFFPAGGGLMSYGVNLRDLYRRAALYVDRLLHGARAADLPVELPTKFELVINLRAAKEIGLDVPPALLGSADQIIE